MPARVGLSADKASKKTLLPVSIHTAHMVLVDHPQPPAQSLMPAASPVQLGGSLALLLTGPVWLGGLHALVGTLLAGAFALHWHGRYSTGSR
jgi:hypothetical protein